MKNSYKIFFTIIASVLIIAGFVLVVFNSGSEVDNTATTSSEPTTTSEQTKDLLVIGDKNAPITIVEYSDYKCPECGKYHNDAGKKIREEYINTGKVKLVFRPYPVYAADGGKALAGSYCANNQGKFTEYYDAVFKYMWVNHYEKGDYQKAIDPSLNPEVMSGILSQIDVNVDEYNQCLESQETKDAFDADVLKAADDGIQGTPSIVIRGQKIVGPQPFEIYKTLLNI